MIRKNQVMYGLAAMALCAGSLPAEATPGRGLTDRQVRALVRAEVAKIRPARGPRGPAGPVGVRGLQGVAGDMGPQGPGASRFHAHVSREGIVDDLETGGIKSVNVLRVSTPTVGGTPDIEYCFSGLPPISGGQVTLDGPSEGGAAPFMELGTGDEGCDPVVRIPRPRGPDRGINQEAGFFILLY